MDNIINFSNYAQSKTGSIAVGESRFARPVPVQIKSDVFIDEAPAKTKNAPDPLKDFGDILRINNYLMAKKRYRDNLIFVMGINFGLRCGDLLRMRVGHILNSDCSFKPEIRIEEEKTDKVDKETGEKIKRGKIRTCYMNDAVMDAAELYLRSMGNEISLNDYLFTSKSNNNSDAYYETLSEMTTADGKPINIKRKKNAPITVTSVERMLKKTINEELGIEVNAGTHLLRKTFAYHIYMSHENKSEALVFLRYILNHSSTSSTLLYIGITDDDVRNTCQNLNLGSTGMNFCYAAGLNSVV